MNTVLWVIAVVLVVGCAPQPTGVGGFNREIIGGENSEGRSLEPVAHPGLQVNKSGHVAVAIQRLPQSVVGASLTTTVNAKDETQILRAWVVALNYSNHEIRFSPSGVSLTDDNQTHLLPLSVEAADKLSTERIRMEPTVLRETVIAPQAFAYGFVYFLHQSRYKLVFPLHLMVKMGSATFEVAFAETT